MPSTRLLLRTRAQRLIKLLDLHAPSYLLGKAVSLLQKAIVNDPIALRALEEDIQMGSRLASGLCINVLSASDGTSDPAAPTNWCPNKAVPDQEMCPACNEALDISEGVDDPDVIDPNNEDIN